MDAEEPKIRSKCPPNKCTIGEYAVSHPNIVAEIDTQIVSGITTATVAEYARARLRDVGIVLNEGQMYQQVYRHKKSHMIEAIRPSIHEIEKEDKLKRDPRDPSQHKVTDPDYMVVKITVPRSQVDKFKSITAKENISAQIQRIENEIEAIEARIQQLPPGDVENYPVLFNMKLKYSAEYRELNRLALGVKSASEETQAISYKEIASWVASQKAKEKQSTTPTS